MRVCQCVVVNIISHRRNGCQIFPCGTLCLSEVALYVYVHNETQQFSDLSSHTSHVTCFMAKWKQNTWALVSVSNKMSEVMCLKLVNVQPTIKNIYVHTPFNLGSCASHTWRLCFISRETGIMQLWFWKMMNILMTVTWGAQKWDITLISWDVAVISHGFYLGICYAGLRLRHLLRVCYFSSSSLV